MYHHICIKSDNSSAVAYINNMGGMTSQSMDQLAIYIWNWCTDPHLFISAQYLPGVLNSNADFMATVFSDSNHFYTPDVDSFASRLNNKTRFFVFWSFDPEAQFTDAFSISWENFEPYIFPPFCLIAKVLNKIKEDNVKKAIIKSSILAYSNMILNINFSVDFFSLFDCLVTKIY